MSGSRSSGSFDAGNDRVVAITRVFATGGRSGAPVELHSAHVHWLDAGCIVRTDEFLTPLTPSTPWGCGSSPRALPAAVIARGQDDGPFSLQRAARPSSGSARSCRFPSPSRWTKCPLVDTSGAPNAPAVRPPRGLRRRVRARDPSGRVRGLERLCISIHRCDQVPRLLATRRSRVALEHPAQPLALFGSRTCTSSSASGSIASSAARTIPSPSAWPSASTSIASC
jgi:hypothetical protein